MPFLWTLNTPNGITLRVPPVSGTAITLSPNVVVLTVGETRTLQALQANGSVASGLTWTSTNPAVASLSTDDPPVITAIAPGNVTIKAGSASADLTIYHAGEIPLGTTLWSVPGPATGVAAINNQPLGRRLVSSEKGEHESATVNENTRLLNVSRSEDEGRSAGRIPIAF